MTTSDSAPDSANPSTASSTSAARTLNASSGICYLVGAGPGDPLLLTLRGRQCLEQAQLILYDALCNPELLRYAPESADKHYVGKRSNQHSLPQTEIHQMLIDATRAGKVVVRLKGGDPFLFGRGGEEAEALAQAGLPFEIIPGISSALAGTAYAGIPLTHRNHNSLVTFFTGHEDPTKPDSQVPYGLLAQLPGTQVLFMSFENLPMIAQTLLKEGASPATPLALIQQATTGQQKTVVTTLGAVTQKEHLPDLQAPVLIVMGETIACRSALNWFETRPLFGQKIAVTRTQKQASSLLAGLRQLGADAYEIPTLRIEPPSDRHTFYEYVLKAHQFDWLIFTSPNGVDAFFEAFYTLYHDARSLGGVRIAAIGPSTAQAIRSYRFEVDCQPQKAIAEEIVQALAQEITLDNLTFLVIRPESSREVIASLLNQAGAIVEEAIAYRTMPETEDIAGGIARFQAEGADWITFTSASTVNNFAALNLPLPPHLKMASIGPLTSEALNKLGWKVEVEAAEHHVDGLLAAILKQSTKGDEVSKGHLEQL